VPHGSTKFFSSHENLGEIFFGSTSFRTEEGRVSSVEDVTATSAVQRVREGIELRVEYSAVFVRGHECGEASPFALMALGHLYSSFALTQLTESGAAIFHAQAYIPT